MSGKTPFAPFLVPMCRWGCESCSALCSLKGGARGSQGTKGVEGRGWSCFICSYINPRRPGPRWEPLSGAAWRILLGWSCPDLTGALLKPEVSGAKSGLWGVIE